jgi:5-methylcytosine-specific restriction endonuclease McrA
MAIGKYVQAHIEVIINLCENSNEHLSDLLKDKEFSNKTFGLSFPFMKEIQDIDENLHVRYWSKVYEVNSQKVRVCSQWFILHQKRFEDFLNHNRILVSNTLEADDKNIKQSKKHTQKNNRYKYRAIGNASNLLIRNILSSIGQEQFTKEDWLETVSFFDNRCAYCGKHGEMEMDHIVPMNKASLGEHKLGNLAPSCKPCNRKKHDKSYLDFLEESPKALENIEFYMQSRNYFPIKNSQINELMNLAYEEVASLAERYSEIINDELINSKN